MTDGQSRSLVARCALALRIVATFLSVGLLWGMWSSDSIAQWAHMWGTAGNAWIGFALLLPGLYVASFLLGKAAPEAKQTAQARIPTKRAPVDAGFYRTASASFASIGAVLLLGFASGISQLPSGFTTTLADIRTPRLNERDEAMLVRGYYENLISVNRHSLGLWNLVDEKPDQWDDPDAEGLAIETGDLRLIRIAPNREFVFKGAPVATNEWGMRDKSYPLDAPADTLRIAVLGQSHIFGSGVANDEVFEAVLEERLNADTAVNRIEVLNFAARGQGPVRQVVILEKEALRFRPDVVLFFGHADDASRAVGDFVEAFRLKVEVPYPGLAEIASRAQLSYAEEDHLTRSRLLVHKDELLHWAYQRIVSASRAAGATPVLVFLPKTHSGRGLLAGPVLEVAGPGGVSGSRLIGHLCRPRSRRARDCEMGPPPECHRTCFDRGSHVSVLDGRRARSLSARDGFRRQFTLVVGLPPRDAH